MGLLDRVALLVRANLNDLIDRAEDPEKMLKQVILDMQNQLIQVKTQVAIAVADRHLLDKKLKENRDAESDWLRKAELAVEKDREDMARSSADRAVSHRQMSVGLLQQLEDQKAQVEHLKSALGKLERKLVEARTKSDMLLAQHRRARVMSRAAQAQAALGESEPSVAMDRMKNKVLHQEALGAAHAELAAPDLYDDLLVLGREDEVEAILRDIRSKKGAA